MKKFILLLIIPFLSFGQLGDYYISKGHPKAKGLNFQIKKPLGFKQKEADRPNIVQKWVKNEKDNDKLIMVMVQVRNLEASMQGFSKDEWKQFLKYEDGVDFLTAELENMAAIKSSYFNIDQQSGIYYEGFFEEDRLDMTFKMYHKSAHIFLNKHMFIIQMMAPSKSVLESHAKLFYLLSNSIIFNDQYKN